MSGLSDPSPGKQVSAEWSEFSEADGALDRLSLEQAGELYGPQPLTCKAQGPQRLRAEDELPSWQERVPPVGWHVPGQAGSAQHHGVSGWERPGSQNAARQEGQQHGSYASREMLRWEAAAMGAADFASCAAGIVAQSVCVEACTLHAHEQAKPHAHRSAPSEPHCTAPSGQEAFRVPQQHGSGCLKAGARLPA